MNIRLGLTLYISNAEKFELNQPLTLLTNRIEPNSTWSASKNEFAIAWVGFSFPCWGIVDGAISSPFNSIIAYSGGQPGESLRRGIKTGEFSPLASKPADVVVMLMKPRVRKTNLYAMVSGRLVRQSFYQCEVLESDVNSLGDAVFANRHIVDFFVSGKWQSFGGKKMRGAPANKRW